MWRQMRVNSYAHRRLNFCLYRFEPSIDGRCSLLFSFALLVCHCFNVKHGKGHSFIRSYIYTLELASQSHNLRCAWCELETEESRSALFCYCWYYHCRCDKQHGIFLKKRRKNTAVGVIFNSYCSSIYLLFCCCYRMIIHCFIISLPHYSFNGKEGGKNEN
jgi:hypothetical protein